MPDAAISRHRQSNLRLPRVDGRGAVGPIVAAAAAVRLGFVVEGSSRYRALRRATTAAHLAALARGGGGAVLRGASASCIAPDTAARKGAGPGGGIIVMVNIPPASGAYAGGSLAVEVLISQTQAAPLLATLLRTPVVAHGRAVAAVQTDDKVCLQAPGGSLVLGGNGTTGASRSVLASNQASPGGISVVGSASVRAAGLVSTGACSGYSSGDAWSNDSRTARPMVPSGRTNPIADPIAGLQGWTPPVPTCGSGMTDTHNVANLSPGQAICSDVSVKPKQTLNLAPEIYYLKNADLKVHRTIAGTGVTILLTGDPASFSTSQINAQGIWQPTGPARSLIAGHADGIGISHRGAPPTTPPRRTFR